MWAVSALCIITTLNGFTYRMPEHLDKILFSGEHACETSERLAQPPSAPCSVNLYGPTEITCNCTTMWWTDFEPEALFPSGFRLQ